MRFIEESEGSFSTAQLAAAERELEEQKKEWELDRLRALREEEERRMRLADDDEEKPLTFGREDAQNQVNSTAANKGGSRRLVNKRLSVPSRRSSRRRGGGGGGSRGVNVRNRSARELSSRSESETTTSTESESESESQEEEDVVEDSLDEESSHTESQSQGDEGEGEEEGDKHDDEGEEEEDASEGNEESRANSNGGNDTERGEGLPRRRGRLSGRTCSRNHFDLNSPRTRSRGNVQINLWTLDVSPILPGVKPNCRRQQPQRSSKFRRVKFGRTLTSSLSPTVVITKRRTRLSANAEASVISNQNTKAKMAEEGREPTRNHRDPLSKDDRDSTKNDRNSTSRDNRDSLKNDSVESEDRDATKSNRDSSQDDGDSLNDQNSTKHDRSPSKNERNSIKDDRESTRNGQDSSKDNRDSTKVDPSSSKDDRGSTKVDPSSSKDDRGSSKDDRPSTKNDRDSSKNDRDSMTSSNGVKQCAADADTKRPVDDRAEPTTPATQTQSNQTMESKLDNAEQSVKEEKEKEKSGSDKIARGVISVCSVQVTRCSQKLPSATYRKLGPEVNRNEDAENLDVNVNTRDSLSSPSTTAQSDVSLKRAKETTTTTTRDVKSITEIVVSANSVYNNSRVKPNVAASKESERNHSGDSSTNRSVPLLRSKTLRSASPDVSSSDKIVNKTIAVSRGSVAQKNSKSGNATVTADIAPGANDEDDARRGDEENDIVEPTTSATARKCASQKLNNSKGDDMTCESEKKTDDSVSNSVSPESVATSPSKSESTSAESKYKIRKVVIDASAISRGVTTRSSKLSPAVVGGANNRYEESNARLTDDKVDSEASKTNSVKASQSARKCDTSSSLSSSPQQLEQSRVTRSTTGRSFTPPLVGDARNSPSRVTAVKRRPDTPLPRPVTRSATTIEDATTVAVAVPSSSSPTCRGGEKHVTRQNSKLSSCQDNGFVSPLPFKRSRSIPVMKPDAGKEAATSALVTAERNPVVYLKRRPDTPRPMNVPTSNHEQQPVSRVTRSGLTLNTAAKAAPSPSSPSAALRASGKQQQLQPPPPPRGSPTREPSANENAERGAATTPSFTFEKPQRTAKVVAILTLDTRSNHQHHNSKAPSSIQPKSAAVANYSGGSPEAKDKEVFVTRLSDSLKEQEADNEGYDSSSDSKSKRLRRETSKRAKMVSYLDNEDGQMDGDDGPALKRVAVRSSSHFSAAATTSASSTQAQTRSEKLRNATLS